MILHHIRDQVLSVKVRFVRLSDIFKKWIVLYMYKMVCKNGLYGDSYWKDWTGSSKSEALLTETFHMIMHCNLVTDVPQLHYMTCY